MSSVARFDAFFEKQKIVRIKNMAAGSCSAAFFGQSLNKERKFEWKKLVLLCL